MEKAEARHCKTLKTNHEEFKLLDDFLKSRDNYESDEDFLKSENKILFMRPIHTEIRKGIFKIHSVPLYTKYNNVDCQNDALEKLNGLFIKNIAEKKKKKAKNSKITEITKIGSNIKSIGIEFDYTEKIELKKKFGNDFPEHDKLIEAIGQLKKLNGSISFKPDEIIIKIPADSKLWASNKFDQVIKHFLFMPK